MIEIKNLTFKYDPEKEVVENINLNIKKNTTTAIIGSSGCGKTTLLYLIAGILDKFEGNILIENENVTGIRKSTGIILQNYGLFPWKTVYENILMGLIARKVPPTDREDKIVKILNDLDIYSIRNQYPCNISGGQKQRTAIARTLILDPDLLLMDEASSALDALTKENIQDLLLEIYNKRKTTMIFVTHSIEEAVFLGQNIIIMNQGRIEQIYNNPYMGEKNRRVSLEFYKSCTEVRKYLEGEVN